MVVMVLGEREGGWRSNLVRRRRMRRRWVAVHGKQHVGRRSRPFPVHGESVHVLADSHAAIQFTAVVVFMLGPSSLPAVLRWGEVVPVSTVMGGKLAGKSVRCDIGWLRVVVYG